MKHIYSRNQLADVLQVSVGSVHRYAKLGIVQAIDLSTWNMHSLYYYDVDNGEEILPMVVMPWGYKVKLSTSGLGDLRIDIETDKYNNLEATCFGPLPDQVWFMDGEEPMITVQIHNRGGNE